MVPTITNAKRVIMINNTSKTNGATATGYVDTAGYDYCSISVILPTSDAVTDKPGTLRITEYDGTQPTSPTNYATVSGFVSGTDYTIPNAISAATSITQPFAVFNVDCRARKRYIGIEVSPTTTQIITAEAILTRAEQTPATTSMGTLVVNG
jgi:hypothetical protein